MCCNRVLFKQFLQANALEFCQIDSARIGGVNEILSVYLMAKKFGGKICAGIVSCELIKNCFIFCSESLSSRRWCWSVRDGPAPADVGLHVGFMYQARSDGRICRSTTWTIPSSSDYQRKRMLRCSNCARIFHRVEAGSGCDVWISNWHRVAKDVCWRDFQKCIRLYFFNFHLRQLCFQSMFQSICFTL